MSENNKIVGIDGQPISPDNKMAPTVQGMGPQGAGPQGPFQPPVDPNTGQPVVNPNTGQPYTQEEFEKAQAEAMQTLDLGCKMLGRVFPDALLIVGPAGIVHAAGEVFRLNKMARMAADDLDKHGESMFRKMGWGARRPGGGAAPMVMPGVGQPPAQPMNAEDKKKFEAEVTAAIQAQTAGQPSTPPEQPSEPVEKDAEPAEKEKG